MGRLPIVLILLLIGAVVAVALLGQLQLMDRLNLLDELRYTVADQVYGVVELGFDQSSFQMTVEPRIPDDRADESDVNAIDAVDDIVLVSDTGARFPLTKVTLRPGAGEQGRGQIVLLFDLSTYEGYPGTERWMLEWPGHEPHLANDGGIEELE